MLRDNFGQLLYQTAGFTGKNYPANFDTFMIWCNYEIIKIKSNDILDSPIIAYKLSGKPYRFNDNGTVYEEPPFPNYILDVLEKIDLSSNCFGYIFTDGLFWIDPIIYNSAMEVNVIDNIIKSDNYHLIKSPVANCIALFGEENNYRHVSRTLNGKTWISKPGICLPTENDDFKKNMEKYKQVKFFIKAQLK